MAHYHSGLVVLSVAIAILASYAALDLATSVSAARGVRPVAWLLAGSVAMGFGIWSMHFTGMLAFHLPGRQISYAVDLVIASVLVAILASSVALWTVTRSAGRLQLLVAGLAMGAAISGMHYTGMAALNTAATVQWRPVLVLASIVIAVVASFTALAIATRVRSADYGRAGVLKLVGAMIMGLAIAGMHYTGMAAATFVPTTNRPVADGDLIATAGLAVAVIISSVVILAIAIAGSILAREMGRRADLTEQLRSSEQYFRALIANASDLTSVLDAQGRHTFVSASYQRVLGHDPQALIGTLALDLVHPDDHARAVDVFGGLVGSAPGTILSIELRVRHADGSWRTLNAFGQNLLQDPAVRGIVSTAHDETDRRKLELQYQQSQKMEAVGQLAGGVAHDFNNLLTVILGNVDLLMSKQEHGHGNELSQVREAAERAAGLTRQLLAFGRRQLLQPRIVDANEVMVGTRQMLERLLGEDVMIITDLQDELWCVKADPGQIEQAIVNLAVNARDAMPSGGTLTFSTRNIPSSIAVQASHDSIPSADYVCLSVQDTGTGIDSETYERMFEPFYTTKDVDKGTGLGLATVYGIMKQGGGYICVQSEMGRGSSFSLYFRRAQDEGKPDLRDVATRKHMGGRETILVVEDENSVRHLVKRVLEINGYSILDCANAAQALQLARDYKSTIHLLLSDVVLPDLNGREVADRISLIRPDIRVIFMSGYTEDETLHRGVLSDGINFLQKPFQAATLLQIVRATLTR